MWCLSCDVCLAKLYMLHSHITFWEFALTCRKMMALWDAWPCTVGHSWLHTMKKQIYYIQYTKYSVEEEWRIVDNQRAFPPQFNSRKESHCLEESKQDRLLKFWKTIFQQWRTNGASRKHSTHLFWTELLIKTDTHLILDETGWISLISFRVKDKCLLCVSTVCCFVLLPVTYFWKPINTTTTESSQKKNTSCITMTAV